MRLTQCHRRNAQTHRQLAVHRLIVKSRRERKPTGLRIRRVLGSQKLTLTMRLTIGGNAVQAPRRGRREQKVSWNRRLPGEDLRRPVQPSYGPFGLSDVCDGSRNRRFPV